MTQPIEKVAVIGAGVMGASIAAHMANGGAEVLLLDIVPEGAEDRNVVAAGAVAKLHKAEPAAFMHKRFAKRVSVGNIEDDLDKLGDCDWVIEAVIERLDIKQDLYRKIAATRKAGSVVSSNTSTLPLGQLVEGLPEDLRRDFLITHFFNPPRYMRLLEMVAGPETDPAAYDRVREFADRHLGKGVVACKDTPGFIANRIGIYWLQCCVVEAMKQKLPIEEVDAVIGRPLGIPRTGVFALLDMVGLDLMPHVLGSMATSLPESDAFHDIYQKPELIERLIAEGYTGRKGKGGFYRLNREGGQRVKEALDLDSGSYRVSVKPKLASVAAAKKQGPRALLDHDDRSGRYAWSVMSRTLSYAASLVPEISDNIASVDEAMRLGFNWDMGPFELLDKVGPSWFAERLQSEGREVPALISQVGAGAFYKVTDGRLTVMDPQGSYQEVKRAEGVLLLKDIKRRASPVAKNTSASLWDIGDGVLCLEFHSKMNSLNFMTLWMVKKAIKLIGSQERGFRGLVIYNEGSNFSVGANIGLLLVAAKLRAWFVADWMVRLGQNTYRDLKHASFPVVAAPSGMALGGGCEILLHADGIQAHGETYCGLVEVGVGVVPAWGGCKELLVRWSENKKRPGGPMPPVIKAFETISMAQVAKSAHEAHDYLFLRPGDGVTMNRDRLLADAKAKVLAMVEDYQAPEERAVRLPGKSALAAMVMAVDGFRKSGKALLHDSVVSKALARVLSGGDTDITQEVSEGDLLKLERRVFMDLARHPDSIARVAHMLKTGKPLRN
ncbi:MAG: 3-hydroxyacyl-CoA dehydrogenase NAD-binding domain-containing protein [Pseudomonadota bacterium]